MRIKHTIAVAIAAASALGLAACSASTPAPAESKEGAAASTRAGGEKSVTVVTHESFNVPDDLKADFEAQTGYKLTIVEQGDAGELTNALALSKDAPLGDAFFGVDNTFASRLIDEGVTVPATVTLPAGAENFTIEGAPGLVPVDMGDVCINADKTWYAEKNLPLPATFEDLVKPEYKDQLVVMNPASSSPGLAFLLATVSHFGEDGYLNYWKQLKENGVKVTAGWSDAFGTDFSAGEGKGAYPLMVSYASSPSYFVNEAGTEASVANLDQTCFRQVEYAGVLAGAKNPEGANKFLEWMLSTPVQESIPDNMYMYPVMSEAALPEALVKFGPLSSKPEFVAPAEIGKHRTEWIEAWTEAVAQ
ncbi:thiamine ABC transporter substrate-binding protein [Buchananella felis]|uniref:thiamine ABC transporter substrate-binding protein n=1 Tax=Buchananella felis TaxID=3231492 RepID=UPI003527885C